MKLSLFWLILIVIAALLIGVAAEYKGRTCPACQNRKKKIAEFFGKEGKATDKDIEAAVMKIV